MFTGSTDISTQERFEALGERIRQGVGPAIDSIVTAEPDHLVFAFGAPAFIAGIDGEKEFGESIRERSGGLSVTLPPESCRRVFDELGARRIAILSPYQPVGAKHVRDYFELAGYDVVKQTNVRFDQGLDIARMDQHELARALFDLDGPDVDVILQVGVNLLAIEAADAVERVIGKPVLALNAVTLWNALRSNGIETKIRGAGVLFSIH